MTPLRQSYSKSLATEGCPILRCVQGGVFLALARSILPLVREHAINLTKPPLEAKGWGTLRRGLDSWVDERAVPFAD
jgi:hypothetical protein